MVVGGISAGGAKGGNRPLPLPTAATTATCWPLCSSSSGGSSSASSILWRQHYGGAASTAAFLVGPFLLHHKRRHQHHHQQQQHQSREPRTRGVRAMATKTKTPPTKAPSPPPQSPAPLPIVPSPAFPSATAAATAASLPRRLVEKPLVDARQLTAAEIQARFADVDFAVPRTLPQALVAFWSHPSILLIAAGLAAIWGTRVAQGGAVGPGEALAVPLTVAGWVVQEWAIHRHLLHGSLQWPGSAIHQQHHDLPFYHISIDPPAIVLAWGAVACALGLALLPQPLAWTVLGTYWLMGLVYEWSHYIVHTRVRPQTRLGRAIKEHHTRHHLRDDRFWFAFSWPPIDALLGTLPTPGTSSSISASRKKGVEGGGSKGKGPL